MFYIILPIILLSLSSCGGGSAENSATATSIPSCASLLRVPAVSNVGAIVVANNALTQTEKAEFLGQINAIRQRGNCNCPASGAVTISTHNAAGTLNWNSTLEIMASNHSEDMMINNFFSHTGSNGSTLAQRASAAGYAFSSLAENIAAGQSTVTDVINSWLSSGDHCRNIMASSMTELGAGMTRTNGTAIYPTYWTMVTGAPL